MLYVAVLALIGFLCASAFRWPVMLICAALVSLVTFVLVLRQAGGHLGGALLQGAGAGLALQIAYVLGGFVMGLRPPRFRAKRNIRA